MGHLSAGDSLVSRALAVDSAISRNELDVSEMDRPSLYCRAKKAGLPIPFPLLFRDRPQLPHSDQILVPPHSLLCLNERLDRYHSTAPTEELDFQGSCVDMLGIAHSF